jgi:hypothetical protein
MTMEVTASETTEAQRREDSLDASSQRKLLRTTLASKELALPTAHPHPLLKRAVPVRTHHQTPSERVSAVRA